MAKRPPSELAVPEECQSQKDNDSHLTAESSRETPECLEVDSRADKPRLMGCMGRESRRTGKVSLANVKSANCLTMQSLRLLQSQHCAHRHATSQSPAPTSLTIHIPQSYTPSLYLTKRNMTQLQAVFFALAEEGEEKRKEKEEEERKNE